MSIWIAELGKLEESINKASGIEQAKPVALAIIQVAAALHRLADLQEKPKSKGAVSWTTANYEEKPDSQTAQLRELSRNRGDEGQS